MTVRLCHGEEKATEPTELAELVEARSTEWTSSRTMHTKKGLRGFRCAPHGSRRAVECTALLTMTVVWYCHGEEKATEPSGVDFVSNHAHGEVTALISYCSSWFETRC